MPVTYKESTYREVLCWTAATKIKYAPNPKKGKSFWRYQKYEKARTPAEAMKLGSYAQDLFFDYEHGFIKVLGGSRRKAPLNPDEETEAWTDTDRMLARMHRSWKTWTKTFSIAEQLGVDRRQLTSDKVAGESAEVRAGRLAANEMAKMILEDAATCNRKIHDNDVLAVLRLWGFRENTNRLNVMKEGVASVQSDTLGLVTSYDGAVILTAPTTEYAAVTKVLCRRLTDHMPQEFSEQSFGWSSINVNANYAGALHRDGNNEGPSFIKAFGDFTGGRLNYWIDDDKSEGPVEKVCTPKDHSTLDISKSFLLFDGNRGHSVEDFVGERFSLVYFCAGQYHKANKTVRDALERCGINFPTKKGMELAKQMVGTPRGYKALSKSKAAKDTVKPAARMWPQAAARKQGANFSSKSMQQKARDAVKQLGTASDCTDTKFVSYRIGFQTLPDDRRRCVVYMSGVSGGERLAVVGDEDRVGSGRYSYKKADGFSLGPALETQRICDVRAWCGKLVPQPDLKIKNKVVLRSYANMAGGESRASLKRACTVRLASAKRARKSSAGGA